MSGNKNGSVICRVGRKCKWYVFDDTDVHRSSAQ